MSALTEVTPTVQVDTLRQAFFSRVLSTIDSPMDLLPTLEKAFPVCDTLPEALAQLDELKKCLDGFRPFEAAQLEKLQEAWDTEYTYESNRIEGNTLTLRETSLVINDGITVGGKSMREHLEAINHRDALRLMRDISENSSNIDAKIVLQLHRLILRTLNDKNAGFYRQERVGVSGSQRIFPNPVKVPYLMDELFNEFEKDSEITHPVILAAKLHHRIVYIHPFVDGNGRTARLMQNLVLLRNGFVIANIKGGDADKSNYYNAIQEADNGNYANLYRIIVDTERQALFSHLMMMSGDMTDEAKGKGSYFFERIETIK